MKKSIYKNGIPVSSSLIDPEKVEAPPRKQGLIKNRLMLISVYAVVVAMAISLIARFLVALINMVTNLSFFGVISVNFHSPAQNHLGLWVIAVPVIGGVLVGLMALYGSKAIRGHGIPEAMEQILVNDSNIKPSITFLKPISSAIAIGTGGPFGAEGPIIATGGALGSTIGQLFKITTNERKVILAAGATAGMSAIFGTPIAGIFLAIELLLFEFSPRSILPVALACITGAAGHHFLFESGPVFAMPDLAIPSNTALGVYSFIGVIIGFLSIAITKVVYFIEDAFEKLPVHWMWWPALGGLAVGLIGYFAPHTLGVGYDNITGVLSGSWPLKLVCTLCFFKFFSWAIALGSGTSGGTLAPLLTIGGAAGVIIATLALRCFPNAGVVLPMAALIGMAAMFAGASRAYLTSIIFALEATMQSHALLPLLGACTAAYMISFFLMENTIMTEKIARRGVATPDSFEPDILQRIKVSQVTGDDVVVIDVESTVGEIKAWINENHSHDHDFVLVDNNGVYSGILRLQDIYMDKISDESLLREFISGDTKLFVNQSDNLRTAVEKMSKSEAEVIPVLSSPAEGKVIGVLSYKNIIGAYQCHLESGARTYINISLKRRRIKMLIRGRKLININEG